MLSNLPDGWATKHLSEIANIKIGRTPSRSKPDYWAKDGDGITWLSIADLKTKIVIKSKEKITMAGAIQSKDKLVKKGTLLMSFKLTIGRTALAGCDLYTNEGIVAIEENANVVNKHFLFQFLPKFVEKIDAKQAVKGKTLNKTTLAIIPVTIPPLKEQERIAEILDYVDESIETTERVVARAERVKRGLMEELLSGGLGSLAIEEGKVPEGWKRQAISDLLIRDTTSINTKKLSEIGDVCYYSISAFDQKNMPIVENGNKIKSNKTLIKDDCLLFSKLNPRIPRVWRIQQTHTLTPVCSTEFWMFTSKFCNISLNFFQYFFGWSEFLNHPTIKPASSTNSHQRVDKKSFDNFILNLPPLKEQERIAKILSSADEKIDANKSVIAQLKRVKAGLMQDLLTGKVRVLQ